MTWESSLEIVVARTQHERFRVVCSEAWPDHEAYRALVISLETGQKPIEYPSLFQQATNLAHAAGSVVASIVRGESASISQEEQDRRLTICRQCEFWDAAQERCSKCGCFGQWKTWLASQQCPIGKW